MRKVLVCGGRAYKNTKAVEAALDAEFERSADGLLVVHGGSSGADAIANAWVWGKKARGLNVGAEVHPADWARHGKAAGPIRNTEMALTFPDVVLAFRGGEGTADMVRKARKHGLSVVCFDD